jgi:hypothetical protein
MGITKYVVRLPGAAIILMAVVLFINFHGSVFSQNDDLKKAFLFMKSEALGAIRITMPAAEVTRALGRTEKQTRAKLWEADGMYHETWGYRSRGIVLDVVSDSPKGKRTVASAEITAPCTFATKKGMKIGSSYDEVKKAYADNIDPEGSDKIKITAGSPYGGLLFFFKGGKVVRIFLGAAAE